jgi:hypothetical protein
MKSISVRRIIIAFWMLVGPPGYTTAIYPDEASCKKALQTLQSEHPADNRYGCARNHSERPAIPPRQ